MLLKPYLTLSLLSLLTIITLLSNAAQAKTPSDTQFIHPFSATYSTTWEKGIHLKIEGTQELKQQNDHTWLFSFKADTFFASISETSLFTLNKDRIQPIKYIYRSSAFGKKREATLTFDWDNNQVTNNVKNKPWKMSIEEGTLDKLAIQLQVRQDIKNNKETLEYQIADGGHVKIWQFKKLGEEAISTKYGKVNAIKVIRIDEDGKEDKTAFWFAEQLDYLLIKLEHKEGKESYLLELEELNTSQ